MEITVSKPRPQNPSRVRLSWDLAQCIQIICSSGITASKKAGNNPRIVPYGSLEIDPACIVLHYGQAVFEGMKAYLGPEGEVLFVPP